MDEGEKDGNDDGRDDDAVEQDEAGGGDLGGALFELKGFGVEGLVPATEATEETSAAFEGVGNAPMKFGRGVHEMESVGEFEAPFELGLDASSAAAHDRIGGRIGGEGDGFGFGDVRVEEDGEHGGEIALETFAPPRQAEGESV